MDPTYKAIFQASPVGGIILERQGPETFIIQDVNAAAAKAGLWKQAHPQDIIGLNILDVFDGIREGNLHAAYHQVLDTGEPIKLGEFVYEDSEVPQGVFDLDYLPLSDNQLLISFVSITRQKEAEEQLLHHRKELQRQNEVFIDLAQRLSDNWGNLEASLQHITEAIGRALPVERTSVWIYDDDHTKIECLDLYEQTHDQHSKGVELEATDYPAYFNALAQGRIIVAHDAHTHEHTHEFSESYLAPLGISSMLDTPIRLEGKMIGVVCHEHVGPRREWTPEEQAFASSVGDYVSLALEAAERYRIQEALRESEERYRSVVTAMAEGISMYDADANLLTCNASAEKILGLTADQMAGRSLIDPSWRTVKEDHSPFPGEEYPAMETLRTGKPYHNVIMGVYKPDDTLTWISINTQPLFRKEEESPYAVVASFIDITQVRQVQEALSASHADLEKRVSERTVELVASNTLLKQEIAERKKAEEALQASQQFIEKVANATPNILYVYDLLEQRNVYTNREITRVLGYDATDIELFGNNFFQHVLHPDDLAQLPDRLRRFEEAQDGDLIETTYRMKASDDTWRWLYSRETVLNRTPEGEPRQIVGTAEDITKRKKTEEALRHQAHILTQTHDSVISTDLEGIVQTWNLGAERIYGYTATEAIGQPVAMLYFPEDLPLFTDHILAPLKEHGALETTLRNRRKDGTEIFVDIRLSLLRDDSGTPIGMIGCSNDITRRKQAEEEQRKTLELLEAFKDHAPVEIFIKDLEGRFLDANKLFEEHFDLNKETLLGKTDFDLVSEELAEKFRGDDQAVIASRSLSVIEESVTFKDRSRTALVHKFPLFDADGEPYALCGVSIDISDRKQAEEALRVNEQRFRLAFDQQFQFMAILSPEGRVLEINDLPLRVQGVQREDYIGKKFWKSPAWKGLPDWQEIIKSQVMQAASSLEPVFTEDVYLGAENDIRYANAAYTAVRNADNTVRFILVQATDTTEHKQAQDTIRKNEAHFRSLIENATDTITILDAQANILYVSPSTERTGGYTPEELIGTSATNRVHPDDIARSLETLSQCFKNPELPQYLEYRLRHKDGSWLTLDAIGQALVDESGETRVVINSRDITERKQAEMALRENEQRWRTLMENVGLIVVGLNHQGNVDYINPHFTQMTGFKREEVLGKHWFSHFLPERDREEVHDAFINILEHSFHPQYQNPIVTKTGEERMIAWSNTRIRDREGQISGSFSIGVDITDREEAERVLRRSQEELELLVEARTSELSDINTLLEQEIEERRQAEDRFRLVVESAPNALVVVDSSGTIRLVNAKTEAYFGYDRDALIGESIEMLIPQRFREQHPEYLASYFSAPKTRAIDETRDLFAFRKDGTEFPVEIGLSPFTVEGEYWVLGAILDITERKQAEDALRESEERLRTVLERMPDGVSVISQDEILYANPALLRMSGYTLEELQGKAPTEFVHPEDLGALENRLRDLYAGGHEYASEYRVLTKYQTVIPVEATSRRIQYGKQLAILSVLHDLTERKEAEAQQERLIAELEAKNTELDHFTRTVSHDLKSPLFTIKGFLGLVEQDIKTGRTQNTGQYIDMIKTAADKMQRLLDELLELSRIGRLANPSEEVALWQLAEEALAMVAGNVAKHQIALTIDPALPVVVGDRVRLVQVFQNLIENAIKFMGDQTQPTVEIGMRKDGEEPVFYVNDNGMGIAPKYQETIFGLFQRLDPRIEGSGIGLPMVKRIIEVHNGRIWVESEGEGHGATFCFTLPQ